MKDQALRLTLVLLGVGVAACNSSILTSIPPPDRTATSVAEQKVTSATLTAEASRATQEPNTPAPAATRLPLSSIATSTHSNTSTLAPTSSTTGLYSFPWSRVEHYYGNKNNYLTISELWGPSGASINNIIPGKYLARGTYDLTGSSFATGEISLGFSGDVVVGEGEKSTEKKTFLIPNGQSRGSFEVVQEILRLKSGTGNPLVKFVVSNTVWDQVILH